MEQGSVPNCLLYQSIHTVAVNVFTDDIGESGEINETVCGKIV